MTLTVPEVLGILALVLATARFLASRLDSIRVDNTAAHAAITENVKENRRQIASLGAKVDAIAVDVASLGSRVDAIAVDVAVLRGWQEERDGADRAAGG